MPHSPLLTMLKYCKVEKLLIDLTHDFYQSVPFVLDRPSSSTLKYHKKEDGSVPSIMAHTLEVMSGIDSMKRSILKTHSPRDYGLLMAAAAMHDGTKYGLPPGRFTTSNHDQTAAKVCLNITKNYQEGLSAQDETALFCMIAYHNGPWSKKISLPYYQYAYPWVLIHVFDMASAANRLKQPMVSGKNRLWQSATSAIHSEYFGDH